MSKRIKALSRTDSSSSAASTSSAGQSSSRDKVSLKDWILLYYSRSQRFSDLLRDDLATITKNCVAEVEKERFEDEDKLARIMGFELVQQLRRTIQKHIEGLQEFDAGMCTELKKRFKCLNVEFNLSAIVENSFEFNKGDLEGEENNGAGGEGGADSDLRIGSEMNTDPVDEVTNDTLSAAATATAPTDTDPRNCPKLKMVTKVLVEPLDELVLHDLEVKNFIVLDPETDNSSNDEDDELLAELQRKDNPITSSNNARQTRTGRSVKTTPMMTRKISSTAAGLSSDDDDNEPLEAKRLCKHEAEAKVESPWLIRPIPLSELQSPAQSSIDSGSPWLIRPRPLSELQSPAQTSIESESPCLIRARPLSELQSQDKASSEDGFELLELPDDDLEEEVRSLAMGTDSDEDEARKLVLQGSDRETKRSEKSPKASRRSGRSRIITPYTGPAITLSESGSDSASTARSTRSKAKARKRRDSSKHRSRNNLKEEDNASNSTSSKKELDFESDSSLNAGKSAKGKSTATKDTHRTKKKESPSKFGKVPNSESEDDEPIKADDDTGSDSNKLKAKKTTKIKQRETSDKLSRNSSSDSSTLGLGPKKSAKKTESEDDSDFIPNKKTKTIIKRRKSSSSDNQVSSSESDNERKKKTKKTRSKKKATRDSSSDDEKESDSQKKSRRRRIKTNSSSGEDNASSDDDVQVIGSAQGSPKGRKNIRKLIKEKDLKTTTKDAAKEEEARKQRLIEKQKLFNQIFQQPESDKLESLVLDFDKKTRTALVSVDPVIVAKLKPHQARGIQFMWNACFESLEAPKSGGCILAHCMGLGKTLQSVAFLHTLINNKKTGIRTVLVICPLNTVGNWFIECRKWTSGAEGRLHLHRLWEEKGNSKYTSLQDWKRLGGIGILHYEGFRSLVTSYTKKGKQKVNSRFLKIIEETLIDPGPDMAFCDEGHLLKNASSQISKAVNRIKSPRRIVLTGTPLQNNLSEYHTMMSFVKPSLLGDIKEFKNRFMNPILNGQHKDSQPRDVDLMKKRAHVLHKMLEGCVQRLDYTVLVPFLPPKYEYVICVNLSEKQKDLYEHYIKHLAGNTGEGFVATKLFADYTILNKICTHPVVLTYKTQAEGSRDGSSEGSEGSLKDFIDDDESTPSTSDSSESEIGWLDDEGKKQSKKKVKKNGKVAPAPVVEPDVVLLPSGVQENGDSGKLDAKWYSQYFKNSEEMSKIELSGKLTVLMEILKVSESVGDKVLIFSQYLTTLDLIEEFLADLDSTAAEAAKEQKAKTRAAVQIFPPPPSSSEGRYRPQIDYFRIDGSTKTNLRQDQCDKFNSQMNKAKLFLISTRAGGLGINLIGANRVIIFDASWNPSQDLQGIFRVYRFGQLKPTYVYRLLSLGTMEEKIYGRQVVKLSLSCRVVDEQQIERHYHYDDLKKMYQFSREQPERITPIVPKDKLLAGLLQTHKDWVYSYLEHDSLLENKQEEELSEAAKQLAWDEYNNEGIRQAQQAQFTGQPNMPIVTVTNIQELYVKNASFFIGKPEWVVKTMWRLHLLHPEYNLRDVGNMTHEIEQIIANVIESYKIIDGPFSLPQDQLNAKVNCAQWTVKLRNVFRQMVTRYDLEYRGADTNVPEALINDVCVPMNNPTSMRNLVETMANENMLRGIHPSLPANYNAIRPPQRSQVSANNNFYNPSRNPPTMVNNTIRVAGNNQYPGSRIGRPQMTPIFPTNYIPPVRPQVSVTQSTAGRSGAATSVTSKAVPTPRTTTK